jgi:hypothetical protein
MRKSDIKEVLDRVLAWPAERQAKLVQMIELVEDYDNNDLPPADQ